MPFAVFLCSKCAEIHSKSGFEVKGIHTEEWSIRELKYIKSGGNEAFERFLAPYDLKCEGKYLTNAANYYRNSVLMSEEQGVEAPGKEAGGQLWTGTEGVKGGQEGVRGLLGKAVAASKSAISGIGNTVAAQSMETSVSTVSSRVLTGADAVSQTIAYQMAKATAATAAKSLTSLYTRFWSPSNPSVPH